MMGDASAPPVRAARGRLGQLLASSKTVQFTEILVVLGVPIVLVAGVRLLPGDVNGLQQLIVLSAVLLMVALAYLGLFLRGQTWRHFGLTFGRPTAHSLAITILQSFAAFAVAAGLFVAAGVGYGSIAGTPQAVEATGLEFLQGNLPALLVTLAVVYVTASFSEEVIYRGFLFNRIAELGDNSRAASVFAVLLSSTAFGFAHYSWGPAGMVQTAFMGLALGTSYVLVGRKLWVVILAHACLDTILLVEVFLSTPAASV